MLAGEFGRSRTCAFTTSLFCISDCSSGLWFVLFSFSFFFSFTVAPLFPSIFPQCYLVLSNKRIAEKLLYIEFWTRLLSVFDSNSCLCMIQGSEFCCRGEICWCYKVWGPHELLIWKYSGFCDSVTEGVCGGDTAKAVRRVVLSPFHFSSLKHSSQFLMLFSHVKEDYHSASTAGAPVKYLCIIVSDLLVLCLLLIQLWQAKHWCADLSWVQAETPVLRMSSKDAGFKPHFSSCFYRWCDLNHLKLSWVDSWYRVALQMQSIYMLRLCTLGNSFMCRGNPKG